jgi:hypothetical protein
MGISLDATLNYPTEFEKPLTGIGADPTPPDFLYVRSHQIDAMHNTLSLATQSRIALRHQRIVAWYDVPTRCGERFHASVSFKHIFNVNDDGKDFAHLEIFVEMGAIRGEARPDRCR